MHPVRSEQCVKVFLGRAIESRLFSFFLFKSYVLATPELPCNAEIGIEIMIAKSQIANSPSGNNAFLFIPSVMES